jgi:hypothetical protein
MCFELATALKPGQPACGFLGENRGSVAFGLGRTILYVLNTLIVITFIIFLTLKK